MVLSSILGFPASGAQDNLKIGSFLMIKRRLRDFGGGTRGHSMASNFSLLAIVNWDLKVNKTQPSRNSDKL